VIIGQFRLPDNRTAVLVNNNNIDFNLWPTMEFAQPWGNDTDALSEVDPVSGRETALLDESPLMAGFQMELQAGMGRLIVVPSAAQARLKTDDAGTGSATISTLLVHNCL
jgi:hypothetical protein